MYFTPSHDFASWLGVKYMLSYDWQERNLSRSWNDAVRANVLGQRVTNSLNFLSEPLKNFTIQLGGDIDYRISNEYRNYTTATDSTISDNGMNNREIWEYSGVLQLGYSGKHFTALAGGRVTKSELYDPNWSARVTIVGQINDRNSIKAIFGQSYRSPSLFEQYFTAGTVTGNIDLNPEQCLSGEILYMGQYKWFFTQLGGYYANIQDRIFRVSRSGNNVYINGSEFNAWGGELELRFAHPKVFDAFVNYALTMGDSADVESGHYNFKYIPVHTGAAGISRSFGGFHVSALGNAMSSALGPQEYIGVQYTLDVSAGYTHQVGNVTLRHSVSAKNVTDQQIEYPEYVRRNTNSVPSGYGRRVSYEFTAGL